MHTFLSTRITLGLVISTPAERLGIWFSPERKYISKYLAEKKQKYKTIIPFIYILSEKLLPIHFS